jgi:hypothetical protein
MEREQSKYSVYLLQEDASRLKDGIIGRCKIGHTSEIDPSFNERRLQIVRSCSPEKLLLRHQIDLPSKESARILERSLHARYSDKKAFDYYSEWFDLSEDDIRGFCSIDANSVSSVGQ